MSSSKKFYRLPEWILTSGLSARAIICYSILADRAELSHKTGKFRDQEGTFIIYPVRDLAERLGMSERTARYCLEELEEKGLIRTRKQGRTRPQRIYVLEEPEEQEEQLTWFDPEPKKIDRQKVAAHDRQKVAAHDRQKVAAHDRQKVAAPSIYTEKNQTDLSISQLTDTITAVAADMGKTISVMDTIEIARKYVRHASNISHPQAWLRTVIGTFSSGNSSGKSGKGYPPTYSIEEYESTSVLDEYDEEGEEEIDRQPEQPKCHS